MTTIAELLGLATGLESDSAQLDAQVLLAHVLDRSRTYLYTWPEREVSAGQEQQFRALLERRRHGEPVSYLVGTQEFWSLPLAVSPATLIPRGDTETLVECALALALPDSARVLDLGTGTGAIALALASEKPHWQLLAVDREAAAVELALRNVATLGFDNISVRRSDWFETVAGVFDLIVSNPPYIADSDPHLGQGDVRFEPRSALVAADEGYSDLAQIITEGRAHLESGGWLLVEHGAEQGEKVRDLFSSAGYRQVSTSRDLAGQPRVSMGQWRG